MGRLKKIITDISEKPTKKKIIKKPKKKTALIKIIDSDNELDNTTDMEESKEEDDGNDSEDMTNDENIDDIDFGIPIPTESLLFKKRVLSFKIFDEGEEQEDFSEERGLISQVPKLKYIESSSNSNMNTLNTPWVEKYRPMNVDDLVLDPISLNKIKKIIEEKEMPNIIITGHPGIGKTTTILCIANNLLGKHFNKGVLQLNASDERGVKSVHETIEFFCKKKLDIENSFAFHKIVLLDEADNMTQKAQQSINGLIKQYQHCTRFAFTCYT